VGRPIITRLPAASLAKALDRYRLDAGPQTGSVVERRSTLSPIELLFRI
jgi:hypothetical protein